jgi:hypothetical protein
MTVLKGELNYLEKSKRKCESCIAEEQTQDSKYKTKLKALEQEHNELQGIWGTFNSVLGLWDTDSDDEFQEEAPKSSEELAKEIQRKRRKKKLTKAAKELRMKEIEKEMNNIKKMKDAIPAQIQSLNEESLIWDNPIKAKLEHVKNLRENIAELKGGDGNKEDDQFDIDGSKDERGHTFLMVVAQNNDLDTARLCFELKANPNKTSPEGFTAMLFAYFFKFNEMVTLIAENGGTYPKQQVEVWKDVESARAKGENLINWITTLRVAERAAVPSETLMESARGLEKSEDSRMTVLTADERKRDFVFFDASLLDPHGNSNNLRRVVLLDKGVYGWFCGNDAASKSNFLSFLNGLKPKGRRNRKGRQVICHRRAVVGIKNTYEVLCAALGDRTHSQVVLFTPFVTSAIEGVVDVGVLGMFWMIWRHQEPLLKQCC